MLMTAFAYGTGSLNGPTGNGLLHGLKLVAVAIVAQAVWGMARTLCPDRERASIAGVAAIIILFSTSALAQISVILIGGLAGLWLCRVGPAASSGSLQMPVSRRVAIIALLAYFITLAALPVLGIFSPTAQLFDAFYRAGALVFGGGHVILPLLKNAFVGPGWVSQDMFLAGYGAAQAMPGPLFTFAAYLGAVAAPAPNGVTGAFLGIIAIFLPSMLVLLGALPFWDRFRRRTNALASLRGVNAAVVGLLGAALYNPLWTGSIKSPGDVAIALACFILLICWRVPPLLVVILGAAAGVLV